MAVWNKKELREHIGHDVRVVYYGEYDNPHDVTIECFDCNEVLVSMEDLEKE